jgi:hypothetical protein
MTSAGIASGAFSSSSTAAPVEATAKAEHVPHRWRNRLTLTGVSIVDNTEMGLTSTLFPTIARDLALNSANLGVLSRSCAARPFAIWLTIFETIGWGLFALGAGQLATALGIHTVFLWILVVLTLVNAVVLGALYLTYPRDVQRVEATLERRRVEAFAAA